MDKINLIVEDGDGLRNGSFYWKNSPIIAIKVHARNSLEKSITNAKFILSKINGHSRWSTKGGISNDDTIGSVNITSPNLCWTFRLGVEELASPGMDDDRNGISKRFEELAMDKLIGMYEALEWYELKIGLLSSTRG